MQRKEWYLFKVVIMLSPPALSRRPRLWLSLAALMLAGCSGCDPDLLAAPPQPTPLEARDGGQPDGGPGLAGDFALLSVNPTHGPFRGGNVVELRGTGFDAEGDIVISFGPNAVVPGGFERIDATRIRASVPAGNAGAVDVVLQIGAEASTLPEGYVYDQVFIEPNRGSTAGGTFVTLTGQGSSFEEGDEVYLGEWPCAEVMIVSENQLTCRTPANAVGTVDVDVRRGGSSFVGIEDGYTYYDTSDPGGGGLGGGESDGTVNITVVDRATGDGVADALVFLGTDAGGPYSGRSDAFGRITFSGPDLETPLTVNVAKHCYEFSSFVSFDAQDVTALVNNLCPEPSPGPPPTQPPPPIQYVSGELIWRGANEYAPNPWDNLPEPRDEWERVAYVYETQPCAEDTRFCTNPDPGLGAATQRVVPTITGELGYPFRIFSRLGGLAVYALAGLENTETQEFRPYLMGIARGILVGPGRDVEGVEVVMDIPLDHFLTVQLEDVPAEPTGERGRVNVRADIDLAGEGVIVRRHAGDWLDRLSQRTGGEPYRFTAQPALHGELSDGRYRVDAFWEVDEGLVTLGNRATPRWHAVRRGIRAVDETVVVDNIVGVSSPTAPASGGNIPADRTLRWDTPGVNPSFYQVTLYRSGMSGLEPLWHIFVDGSVNSAVIPNVDPVAGLSDPATSAEFLAIHAVTIPGFDFDAVSYADLAESRHANWALKFIQVN